MDNSLSKWTAEDAVGGAWLADRYGVEPVQPLRTLSRIGRSRGKLRDGNWWQHTYIERYRPPPTLASHLGFFLRYEVLNLEFLARLFRVIDPEDLASWVRNEPSGKYARRAGFLYEWLTGTELDFDGVGNAPYTEILTDDYLTASNGATITRWHVRNNLPGETSFCPVVYLSDSVKASLGFGLADALTELEGEFGKDLLIRSSVWLTLKESRSSFEIEGEQRHVDRIRRFAAVLESEVGRHPNLFALDTLEYLQKAIIGDHAASYGVRKSPIFVGETRHGMEIVHYIAPHWNLAAQMLKGLSVCEASTREAEPIIRAAVLSFGFVYAHPLTDGNGRISRFLINDVLRRDGAVAEPIILPISSVIARSMREYDRTLEILSKPLMNRYSGSYRFGRETRYEDGLSSTFQFDGYQDAEPVWRYPDLTDHVEYLSNVIRETVTVELRDEARQIKSHRAARAAANAFIEGPDETLDRIVRSIRENNWSISGKLLAEIPALEDEVLAAKVVDAVRQTLENQGSL